MAKPTTSTITWNSFPEQKPVAIYESGQTETKNYYFVEMEGDQITVLMWHTKRVGSIARWEWPCGSVSHGTVLRWATPTSS